MQFTLKIALILGFSGITASIARAESPATHLGAFEVTQITSSSRGHPPQDLCGGTEAVNVAGKRRLDCGARVHAFQKDGAIVLSRNEGSRATTFLLYPNPFKRPFCESQIPAEAHGSAEAIFSSKACRAYLAEDGSYYFSEEKDAREFMIESQIVTFSTMGVPLGVHSHLKIWLDPDHEQPAWMKIRERVEGSIFFISTAINYDYLLDRI